MTAHASLVDVDPDLTAGVPEEDAALARRALVRPRYDIPAGRWSPELLRGHDNGAFALLLIDGVVLRQLDLADRQCMQLMGPGDVLHTPEGGGTLDCPVSWTALKPSSVIVLDDRFTLAAQRWPALAVNLQRRLLDLAARSRADGIALQLVPGPESVMRLFDLTGTREVLPFRSAA